MPIAHHKRCHLKTLLFIRFTHGELDLEAIPEQGYRFIQIRHHQGDMVNTLEHRSTRS